MNVTLQLAIVEPLRSWIRFHILTFPDLADDNGVEMIEGFEDAERDKGTFRSSVGLLVSRFGWLVSRFGWLVSRFLVSFLS